MTLIAYSLIFCFLDYSIGIRGLTEHFSPGPRHRTYRLRAPL
jgi:hypothetical protein